MVNSDYKITLPKHIIALVVLVVVLVLGFTIRYDSDYFFYLLWNIFLAFIPFLISSKLLWYKNKEKKYPVIFVLGLTLWLVVFPNAPYVVTDLIHLIASTFVPLWINVILLFSSAWIGIFLGIISLFHIEQIILPWFGRITTDLIILGVILLSSFGVYLGRFLRWNSWDIFLQPKAILNDFIDIFSNPLSHKEAYITTIVFFVLITVSYNIWKSVFKETR
ncbi:MAG: DUF1361 domain-containing protein [bacterium]